MSALVVKTPYGTARLVPARYRDGGLALRLVDAITDEPMTVLTVNVPSARIRLEPDQVFVKTWSENEPLVGPMLSCGLFEDTGLREPTGFVAAAVWRLIGPARYLALKN